MFTFAMLPTNKTALSVNINSAAERLFNKLNYFNVKELNISDYNKQYFQGKLTHLTSCLRLYSYILSWSLAKSDVPLDEFVFLDYGGGSGMLSLLAKELGIGTVIYNDIYDVSCHDAKLIAESIGNSADYYVCGDIDEVLDFLRANNIDCHAIASYDVIEHIYDLESFFRKLTFCSKGPLTIVMSSGSNIFNPLCRRKQMKQQLDVEYQDREKKWGHKERDCLMSYLKVRREIIAEYIRQFDNELEDKDVAQLAKNTRGMDKADIEKATGEYLKTGSFPPPPTHPTNTCDPYTGNWMEHLFDPCQLAAILSQAGFKTQILSGYYGCPNNIIKRLIGTFLNRLIFIFKKHGIRIAAFITVYGIKNVPAEKYK
jgi:2-polyprenyl-3-methyl-5-hydroxy-6-metoxy-1,4-benzoquinol methylase